MTLRNEPFDIADAASGRMLSESLPGIYEVLHPDVQSIPLVLASPHSGAEYPAKFLAASRLGPTAIRSSEDAFVDRLFSGGPERGAPLIRALFPRAYLDVNREPYELDPDMFDGPLPPFVNAISPRASIGLGTVARIVGHGQPIYPGKLSFADVQNRIDTLYYPYHARLEALVRDTRARFGVCILLDCHSMPTQPNGGLWEPTPDIVLGDGFGSTCAAEITDAAEAVLADSGLKVTRNRPYAGGFTTRHYGRPRYGVHALQVEVARRLYMEESDLTPLPEMAMLMMRLTQLIETVGAVRLPLFTEPDVRAAD